MTYTPDTDAYNPYSGPNGRTVKTASRYFINDYYRLTRIEYATITGNRVIEVKLKYEHLEKPWMTEEVVVNSLNECKAYALSLNQDPDV